jgi:hypothetical protein
MSQHTQTPESPSVISMMRYLERRQLQPFESGSSEVPFLDHPKSSKVHRIWPPPFLKPTACGHRPLARFTPQQKNQQRLQKAVVKTIVYEFSTYSSQSRDKNASESGLSKPDTQNSAISKAWLTLADLVLNRMNAINSDPSLS